MRKATRDDPGGTAKMHTSRILGRMTLVTITVATAFPAEAQHSLTFGPQEFLLDGKPFRIISGEIHPARRLVRFIKVHCKAAVLLTRTPTPQSERGHFPASHPTCGWTAEHNRRVPTQNGITRIYRRNRRQFRGYLPLGSSEGFET